MRELHYAINIHLIDDDKEKRSKSFIGHMDIGNDISDDMIFLSVLLNTTTSLHDNIIK